MAANITTNDEPAEPELYPYPGTVKSTVWQFFKFKKKGVVGPATKSNLDETTVICKLCKKKYANKGNTTNLQFHLDSQHKELKQAECETQAKKQPRIYTNFNISVPAHSSKAKQDQIDDALMQMIVGKVLPISLVENEYFLKFVTLLDSRYKVPDRKKLLKGLEKKKLQIEQKIKAELAECHDIAITHDGWTSCSTESYSTVTGHYIDKNWRLKSVSISTTKVEGSHTSENIAQQLETVKMRWNLPNCIAVSNNATNEKKAFEILNWVRFGCFGHRINLIVRHSLTESSVARMVRKGRKLVAFYHQSSSANDMLVEKHKLLSPDETPLRLIQDVVTRWNSTYLMLQRVIKLLPAVVASAIDDKLGKFASTSIKTYTFSFEEQLLAERLVALLEPFQNATSVKAKMHSELEKRTQDTGMDLALLACILNTFTKRMKFLGAEQAKARGLLEEKAVELFTEMAATIKIKREPPETQDDSEHLPVLPVAPDGLVDEVMDTSTDISSVEENPVKKIKIERSKETNMDDWWLHDVLCTGESEEPVDSTIK